MAAHDDLLAQARYLITHDRGKPKQVSLRRAVSTAYYALFHLLTSEAASRLMTGKDRDAVRMMLRRSFTHSGMNSVCKDITKTTVPDKYKAVFPAGVSNELKNVAQAFVDLQQARHEADYDFSKVLTRVDTADSVLQAENAFADWKSIRKTVEADTFLAVMLIAKRGNQSE